MRAKQLRTTRKEFLAGTRGVRAGTCILGPGNWGSSLLAACREAQISVPEVVRRKKSRGDGRSFMSLSRAKLNVRLLWLCVPDSAIGDVCEMVVAHRPNLQGQIVVHSSGALSSEILALAEEAGAMTASVHPLMSFPTRRPVSLKGVPFAVETAHAAARRELQAMVRKLGGRPFPLGTESKAIYHAAGTLASPLVVSAVVAAEQVAVQAGLSRQQAQQMVGQIAQATVRNYAARGAGKSFSGPFARGDFQTIGLHLRALDEHPSLARVYRELAKFALEQLPSRNRREIERLLAVPPKGSIT